MGTHSKPLTEVNLQGRQLCQNCFSFLQRRVYSFSSRQIFKRGLVSRKANRKSAADSLVINGINTIQCINSPEPCNIKKKDMTGSNCQNLPINNLNLDLLKSLPIESFNHIHQAAYKTPLLICHLYPQMKLSPFQSGDSKKGNWLTVQTQIRCCRMWCLIRVSTVCK